MKTFVVHYSYSYDGADAVCWQDEVMQISGDVPSALLEPILKTIPSDAHEVKIDYLSEITDESQVFLRCLEESVAKFGEEKEQKRAAEKERITKLVAANREAEDRKQYEKLKKRFEGQ